MADGAPRSVSGAAAERRRAEQALGGGEIRLRVLFDSVAVGIGVVVNSLAGDFIKSLFLRLLRPSRSARRIRSRCFPSWK